MHTAQNCRKILGKLRKVMKLVKMFLIKFASNYFFVIFSVSFQKFSENLKIVRKPPENDFGLISWKIFSQKIVSKLSEYFRFCHLINYLLTRLLVPYREILSPHFLRTDLASSVHTSKPQALYFTVRPLHPVNI